MALFRRQHMLEAGAQVPEIQLQTMDGATHALRDIIARGPALLAFFKVSCPVCQMTFPFLERLDASAGKDRGPLQIVGVSQDNVSATRQFIREYGLTFPVLLDDAKQYPASNAFGISVVPSIFVVEPDGRVSAAFDGFSKADLEAIGARVGASPFQPGDRVPEFRPG